MADSFLQVNSPVRAGKQPQRRGSELPLAVDAKHLGQLLGAGVRTIRTWDAAGKLPAPIRIGGRVVWYVPEIRQWLEASAPDRATWEAMKAARPL